MVINRFRTIIKRGRRKEAIEYIKQNMPNATRLCLCYVGKVEMMEADFEYKDMVACAAHNPKGPRLDDSGKWSELTASNEIELLWIID